MDHRMLCFGPFQVVCKLYSEFTGKDEDFIREEIDRDNFLSPAQAIEMGLIDQVLD